MRWADDQGRRIDALALPKNHRTTAPQCPNCGAAVHFRPGKVREAHFAHNHGSASDDCENYSGVILDDHGRDQGWESSKGELGLAVVLDEDTWTLLVRLPELSASELEGVALSSLVSARVVVRLGPSQPHSEISALEVRAGIDAARLVIAPTTSQIQLTPSGKWPDGVRIARWRATARGLAVGGVLLRRRAGEWHRLAEGAQVVAGEKLMVLARGHEPPSAVAPKRLGVNQLDQGWCAWLVELPNGSSPSADQWLSDLGHERQAAPWSVVVACPPQFVDEDIQLYARDALIVEIRPPPSAELDELTISSGTISENHPAIPGFYMIDTPHDEVAISLNRDSRSAHHVGFRAPITSQRLDHLIGLLPHLTVSWGENQLGPGVHRVARADQSVAVDCGGERARVDLIIENSGGPVIHPSISAPRCALLIDESLASANRFSIDAGALGYVAVELTDERSATEDGSRIDAWLWTTANSAGPWARPQADHRTLAWAGTVTSNSSARSQIRARHHRNGRR